MTAFDFAQHKNLLQKNKRIFFVGIGGISMSGLAELALRQGQVVAGSDLSLSDKGARIRTLGIPVHVPHAAENIDAFQPDAVVYSAAVPASNPELQRAQELAIPCLERSKWLGLLNREYPAVVNIAGTNGKSTTTAMCAYICMDAGLDPTVHLGAELDRFHSSIHVGGNDLMLSEACEFNYSFYYFYSTITTILNIGHDHVDIFPTLEDVIATFAHYLSLQAPGTKVVLPSFDENMPRLLQKLEEEKPGLLTQLEIYYFGYAEDEVLGRKADLLISELRYRQGLPQFRLHFQGEDWGEFSLAIPGQFNVENAAAAVLLSHLAGADYQVAKRSLQTFKGAEGRFTVCGKYRGALVVNDYAHHPDSVRQTINAALDIPHKRLFACLQPITYSRAKGLFADFVDALREQKDTILVEVYDDREVDRSFSSAHIAAAIKAAGGTAKFMPNNTELEKYLRAEAGPGDLILLMGQDIRQVGDRLAERQDHYTAHHSLEDSLPGL